MHDKIREELESMSQNPQLREGYCAGDMRVIIAVPSQNPQLREGYCAKGKGTTMKDLVSEPSTTRGLLCANFIIVEVTPVSEPSTTRGLLCLQNTTSCIFCQIKYKKQIYLLVIEGTGSYNMRR